jgi:alkylation response protein AidB-like acyl-CoA dehydrogenase
MGTPGNFGFDEQAQLLKQNARRMLQAACPLEQLFRLIAADTADERTSACVWDPNLWASMVELGWTSIAVPEASDGFGMSLVAIAGLVEELGRAAAPSPLIATMCATRVLAACGSAAGERALARIVEGTPMSLALCSRRGSWELADTEVTAAPREGSGERELVLDGTAWFVQDAQKAGAFVVAGRGPTGVGLYLVDADAPGVTVIPDAIIDLTRDQAHVELRGVTLGPEHRLARAPEAGRAYAAAEPAMLVMLAADMVGAAEWQLQTTAEYARTRVQFDRPIGFFQAVKHPLVDMMVMIDEARSLVYAAAASCDHEPERAQVLARMAKAAASDAASFCSGRSVQLHGGIGFTWECFVQLYFKRQKHNEVLLGDAIYQRAKLADVLIGPLQGSPQREDPSP